MGNENKLHKLMALSPHIEMIVRRIYWNKCLNKYLKFFKSLNSKQKTSQTFKEINLNEIKTYLLELGIKKGDIVIIHSSYKPFELARISPQALIKMICEVIGQEGTLAMPVIRRYSKIFTDSIGNYYVYNLKKSRVWTGMIPFTLMRMKNSVTSQFPINTLTAVGKDAKEMMKNNLVGELPTANGENSSWKYCLDRNAWCISIGTDLTHSLTMLHTAEDLKKDTWPIQNWYVKKRFKIIDDNLEIIQTVLEKNIKWGRFHFGERTLAKDLLKNKIMTSKKVEDILIESLRSKDLIDFLNSKNHVGYPYFWV